MASLYTKAERSQFKEDWPKGSPRPPGYVHFFQWAQAQHDHGLRQRRCTVCGLFTFPQQRVAGRCTHPNMTADSPVPQPAKQEEP